MKNNNYHIRKKVIALILMTALVWSFGLNSLDVSAQTDGKVISMSNVPKQDTISSRLLGAFEESSATSNNAGGGQVSRNGAGAKRYVVASVEFTTTAARQAQFSDTKISKIAGATVLTTIDRFADVFLPNRQALTQLGSRADVVRVEEIGIAQAPPPVKPTVKKVPSKAVPEDIVRGGLGNLKGKNVIIAVLDTGVDFRHSDFITYDAAGRKQSRLLYLWDTSLDFQKGRGNVAPVKYPNGASIGTLFTKDQLTAELNSTKETIPATDLGGHGTACASIAAGNGNADFKNTNGLKRPEVIGVAPQADIIAVRMGEGGFENDYLLNTIIEWLDREAKTKPLVVSASYGHLESGHDGQTVQERQMNARFPLTKQKRAFVVAAGNEGVKAVHTTVQIGNKENSQWINYTARRDEPLFMYFDTGDISDIEIEAGEGAKISLANAFQEYNKITKQARIVLEVQSSKGAFRIYSRSGKQAKADLYFSYAGYTFQPPSWFDTKQANFQGFLRAPGTMDNGITVASYDWNDNFHVSGNAVEVPAQCLNERNEFWERILERGKLSCYSSPGPTRTGKRKPEIASPGQYYTSSVAKANNLPVWDADTTGNYTLMNGTSAATPYTAGIVALMFEKKPTLTLGKVRELLSTKASRDPFTGVTPNDYFGAGKLDKKAVEAIIGSL